MPWGLPLEHCPGIKIWVLLSHALPLSSKAGWLNCVPSLVMLSQLLAPPTVHTAPLTALLWYELHVVPSQKGTKVWTKAGVTSCHAPCLQYKQNQFALKSPEDAPEWKQPRYAPWSGRCGVFLCSHQREQWSSLHLSVTPSFSSRMKISLSCHVRQERVLWGHIATRYTLLTSASPLTSSHLHPVTWTMQQIDLLLSYHSSTIFLSEKKLMLNVLEAFKKIPAEVHVHWGGFDQVVITHNKLITVYLLEIIRGEVQMKYIRNSECGCIANLMLKKDIMDSDHREKHPPWKGASMHTKHRSWGQHITLNNSIFFNLHKHSLQIFW